MAEVFKADPKSISGLGNLVGELNINASKAVNLVKTEGRSSGEFKGLMSFLKTPVDSLNDATVSRQGTLPSALHGTSVALKQTAWNYTTTENNTVLGFQHTKTLEFNMNPLIPQIQIDLGMIPDPVVRTQIVDDVPGATSFPAPQTVDLSAPPR